MSEFERQTAWSDPATREAWRTHRRIGIAWLLAGVVTLVSLVAISSYMEQREEALLHDGDRVPGTVVGRALAVRGAIKVEYEYRGKLQQTRINLNSSSPSYTMGQEITLVIDPDDPSRVRTPEESNNPQWASLVFVASAVLSPCLLIGGWTIRRRSRRWRPALERSAWELVPVEHAEVPAFGQTQLLVRWHDGDQHHVMAPASQARWRRRQFVNAQRLHIVWLEGSRALGTPGPGDPMFELYVTRRARRLRQWRAAFDAADVDTSSP